MGLLASLGFNSSKSKSSSTGTIDQTSLPVVPDWLDQMTRELVAKRQAIGNLSPYEFVANANPILDQATNFTSRLPESSANFGKASAMAGDLGAGSDVDLSSLMGKFKDPYQKDVIDAALADYDFGAGQTRARQTLDLAGGGGFQGSGMALTKSATEDALTRGRGGLSAGLNKQGWDDTLGAAVQQASMNLNNTGQRLGAAQTLGNLGTAQGADARANIDALLGTGDMIRGVEQEKRSAPLNMADWTQQMPDWLQALIGEHTTGTTTSDTKGKQSGFNASVGFK